MKRKIALLLAVLFIFMGVNVSAVKMYSVYGKTSSVHPDDVSTWKKVGWYEYPVVKVYALDGRTEVISKSALKDWKAVGWYDYPVMKVYAPDGRTQVISKSAFSDWRKVGWYNKRIMTPYTHYNNKINEYYRAMYVDDDVYYSTWKDYSSINRYIISYERRNPEAKIYYALHDINWDSVPELVIAMESPYPDGVRRILDIYTLNNGKLVKIFKDASFGDRGRLHILADGTLLSEGAGSAASSAAEVYQLNRNGSLTTLDSFYCDGTGPWEDSTKTYMNGYDYEDKCDYLLSRSVTDSLKWYVFCSNE